MSVRNNPFVADTIRLHRSVGMPRPRMIVINKAKRDFAHEVHCINQGLIAGHKITNTEINLLLSAKLASIEVVNRIAQKFPTGAYSEMHRKFYLSLDVLPNFERLMDCFAALKLKTAILKYQRG